MSSSSRVVFVDLLRFAAALQMLQGHTIAALLAPEYRHGWLYASWSTARGLTSVAFLFAAGLSFYLATERPAAVGGGGGRWSTTRGLRALRLIGFGYLLHLPLAALGADSAAREAALREFLAVDVLQCIGVSLLLLEALRASIESPRLRLWAALAIGVFLLGIAPIAGQLPASGLLRPLLAYASPSGGSLFPLTPWGAHVFVGYACGAVVRRPAMAVPSAVPQSGGATGPLAALGIRLAVIAAFASLTAVGLFACGAPPVICDHVSRLAGVLVAVWPLWFIGERLARVPRTVATLAQHTLVLYVFHVLLVYGAGVGFAAWIGPRLAPGWALSAAVLVIAASAGVALRYDRLAGARRTG